MKKLFAFLTATPIVWIFLIWTIGMPFIRMLASLNLGGTPLFIQTDEQAATVARWMLAITGMTAVGFGIQTADIVADCDRFIQRLFTPGRRRRYYR
jgi:hypothetical protein